MSERRGIERLTIEQIRNVHARVTRDLPYLNKLVQRMERVGFLPGDEIYDAALHAKDALVQLHLKLHYATCTGVARPAGQAVPMDHGDAGRGAGGK